MRKIITSIVLICFLILSCSPPKNTSGSPNAKQDGLSYETAVVINEKRETTGINAEYKWLKEHYPGYMSEGQALQWKNKIPYDVISIKLPDEKKLDVYFNISKFYGKF
jgi:hypothetical protein